MDAGKSSRQLHFLHRARWVSVCREGRRGRGGCNGWRCVGWKMGSLTCPEMTPQSTRPPFITWFDLEAAIWKNCPRLPWVWFHLTYSVTSSATALVLASDYYYCSCCCCCRQELHTAPFDVHRATGVRATGVRGVVWPSLFSDRSSLHVHIPNSFPQSNCILLHFSFSACIPWLYNSWCHH